MFKAGDFIIVTGGSWVGHRGVIAVTPEQEAPSAILVTVERAGRGRTWDGTPILEYHQHWIAPGHLAPFRRPA